MNLIELSAILITLVAIFGYLNAKILKLPATIGLMVLAMIFSVGLLVTGRFVPTVSDSVGTVLNEIDFNEALMHGMLGFLLFAGALHVNLNDLREQKWIIAVLATVGVLMTTGIVGGLMWWITGMLGLEVKFIYCLLFGSLIAPTDPIAVLAILKTLGVPKSLETKITGESLFNDGVGVVVFIAILGVAGLSAHGAKHEAPLAQPSNHETQVVNDHEQGASVSDHNNEDTLPEVDLPGVGMLFLKEAGGGAVFGLVLGCVGYLMMRSLDEYKTEIMITLAMVTGGYVLCMKLHISGPIAMVVAGLFIGNQGRALAMSETTRANLDLFWELVDEILNAVLFVLIGIEILVVAFTDTYVWAGLIAIPVVLLARFVSVGGAVQVIKVMRKKVFTNHAVKVMTWGGLRGGISVALALSLNQMLKATGDTGAIQNGELIVTMTYVVVVFSIVVQGLSVGPLLGRLGLSGQKRLQDEH
ncbi:cation:proton antiporter [Poriferisphaera sp. WC338]|uniref:cation:proton antiporter n=1 Tax=Poriferisphaera sp. WC338 TaxID=3425129 RepID=UPI003D817F3A